jgi:hypothetical protein
MKSDRYTSNIISARGWGGDVKVKFSHKTSAVSRAPRGVKLLTAYTTYHKIHGTYSISGCKIVSSTFFKKFQNFSRAASRPSGLRIGFRNLLQYNEIEK